MTPNPTLTQVQTRRPARRWLVGRLVLAATLLASATVAGLGLTASPAAAATCPPAIPAPFTDVPGGHPFCREIAIAADHGAVSGYPDGSFHPTEIVNRQEAVKILWNAVNGGGTAAPCVVQPFTDVAITDPFCGEIRDAADVGVVNGFPDGSFHPTAPVSRQATAAMLWRFPEPGGVVGGCVAGDGPFTDVPSDHPFCPEIALMKFAKVAEGYPDGSFHPTEDVSRQAFVAMMVRWIAFLDI